MQIKNNQLHSFFIMKFEATYIEGKIQKIISLSDLVSLLNEFNRYISRKEGKKEVKITDKQVKYFLYYLNKDVTKLIDVKDPIYTEFEIAKRSGGVRIIHAPSDGLKNILKCIDFLIRSVFKPHRRAFGFVKKKSIVENAKVHTGKNYVYNIDLKDFFHSFEIQQVKWAFFNNILEPIHDKTLRENLSFTLACLATYTIGRNRTLPQGSPCSPSLTNILCKNLDRKLNKLAKKNGAEFSRYADDISFSANHNAFKENFVYELKQIIRDEKLEINPKKTRLQRGHQHQEVTGLTVNQGVNVSRAYIKQLRAILYLCERYGIRKAQHIIASKNSDKTETSKVSKVPDIELFLKGKLNYLSMVKGRDNPTYHKLENRYNTLFPKKTSIIKSIIETWNDKGIDACIKRYAFKLETKAIKQNNAFLDSDIESWFRKLRTSGLNVIESSTDKSSLSLYFDQASKAKPWKDLIESKEMTEENHAIFLKEVYDLFSGSNFFSNKDWVAIFNYWKKKKSFKILEKLLFFALVLNNDSITKAERVIISDLWAETKAEPKNIESTSVLGKKNLLKHNPEEISKFLNIFKENNALKWSVHAWDSSKYKTIDYFIAELEEWKNKHLYTNLYNRNRDLYNLIKYFLYSPNINIKGNEPEYSWPNLPSMKMGWQFPNNILKNWYEVNQDEKTPSQFILPKELRPERKVKGIEVKKFEDVIDVFKTEIQFRDRYFLKEIQKIMYTMEDFEIQGIDKLENLPDFFTYTRGVVNAIKEIFNLIKNNESANKVIISFEVNDNSLGLYIVQPNSYPQKTLTPENPNSFLGGQLNSIAGDLFSLADFSIISRFKKINNEEVSGELIILDSSSEGEWLGNSNIKILSNAKFKEIKDQSNGFTYKLIFSL